MARKVSQPFVLSPPPSFLIFSLRTLVHLICNTGRPRSTPLIQMKKVSILVLIQRREQANSSTLSSFFFRYLRQTVGSSEAQCTWQAPTTAPTS